MLYKYKMGPYENNLAIFCFFQLSNHLEQIKISFRNPLDKTCYFLLISPSFCVRTWLLFPFFSPPLSQLLAPWLEFFLFTSAHANTLSLLDFRSLLTSSYSSLSFALLSFSHLSECQSFISLSCHKASQLLQPVYTAVDQSLYCFDTFLFTLMPTKSTEECAQTHPVLRPPPRTG